MWLTPTKSKTRIRNTSLPNPNPNPNSNSNSNSLFSCSSFKDIQFLCAADGDGSSLDPKTPPRKPHIFHRVRRANAVIRAFSARRTLSLPGPGNVSLPDQVTKPEPDNQQSPSIHLPGGEGRVVVYLTNLRVVRSTFESCSAVRSILQGFRVKIDERDLSMDPRFGDELRRVLGDEKTKVPLPRVFINGRYVGGVEEVRQLNETGELKRMMAELPRTEGGACETCGGCGFIVCGECSGSHKVYGEKGFRSCTLCIENGLVRCRSCSGPVF